MEIFLRMAANPQVGRPPPGLRLPNLPAAALVVVLAAVFSLGLLATALLAVATQSADSSIGTLLGTLLGFSEVLPFLLLVCLVPAVFYMWRNRSRLARRLMVIMLFQFGLAAVLALMPFWIVSKTTEIYFDDSVTTGISLSTELSEGLLSQVQLQLESTAAQSKPALAAAIGDSLAVGILLDELRSHYSLDVVAVIDGSGRIAQISPVSGVVEGASPFMIQQLGSAKSVRTLVEQPDGPLKVVHVEPLPQGLESSQMFGLWLEHSLPAGLSDSIRDIEQSSQNYRRSRALRTGVSEALTVVVVNAVLLLLFVAINLSVYTGTRLGHRLGTLAAKMESVANMSHPRGGVSVTGNDEITQVSRSFNEMVSRVGGTIAREKRMRDDLESIQNTIHSGLLVLDYTGRIQRHNKAALDLLGLEDVKDGASLRELAEERPGLMPFANFCKEAQHTPSGEIKIDNRKFWVRTSLKGDGSPSRIVMFTDISEPLALEELRSRQDALNFTLHGLKNPLQPLLYHSESLDELVDQLDEKGAELLMRKREKLLHGIGRLNEQIEGMRMLVNRTQLRYGPVDVNATVREIARNMEPGDSEIEFDLADELAPMNYVREELADALENMLVNARQQFELVGKRRRTIRITTRMNESNVELSVQDNAGGVPEELQELIFKPHMSYKSDGHGIGLAGIKKSVLAAKGTFTVRNVETRLGSGACFTMSVPQAQVLP